MTRQLRETRLYPPVKVWLESQGYIVFPECWECDVVAHKDENIIAVELKMSLSRGLMHQLYRAAVFANVVYAAVASKPRRDSLERFLRQDRIGVLRVTDKVEVLAEPHDDHDRELPWHHAKALAALRGWQPADEPAGVPMLKGCGPAQKCAGRVRQYLKENPNAGWREIFRDVTNHYAHHRSMRGALPPIEMLKTNRSEHDQ